MIKKEKKQRCNILIKNVYQKWISGAMFKWWLFYMLVMVYMFSKACFWSTPSWNLTETFSKWFKQTESKKTYLRSCSFSWTSLSNSDKIDIWVSFKCWMCWTAKKFVKKISEKKLFHYLLRCNNATLLIFLFKQAGNSFLNSSNPSLIWALLFCSDWIWICLRSSVDVKPLL